MNEVGKWQVIGCPVCGKDVHARQHDYSTKHIEHLYVEFAPHWDWLNRVCIAANGLRRGVVNCVRRWPDVQDA